MLSWCHVVLQTGYSYHHFTDDKSKDYLNCLVSTQLAHSRHTTSTFFEAETVGQFLSLSRTIVGSCEASSGIKCISSRSLMRLRINSVTLVKSFNHLRLPFPSIPFASTFVFSSGGSDAKSTGAGLETSPCTLDLEWKEAHGSCLIKEIWYSLGIQKSKTKKITWL